MMYELKGPLGTACLCISSLSCEPLLLSHPPSLLFHTSQSGLVTMVLVMIYRLFKCRAGQPSTAKAEAPRRNISTFAGLLSVTQVHRFRGRDVFLDVLCKVSSNPRHEPSICFCWHVLMTFVIVKTILQVKPFILAYNSMRIWSIVRGRAEWQETNWSHCFRGQEQREKRMWG